MTRILYFSIVSMVLGTTLPATAADGVTTFSSPNGLTEECRILPALPGAKYDKDDPDDEAELCQVDFYAANKIALCPKTWSTSPGTMVYDISGSKLSQKDYEAQPSCGGDKKGHEKITKFKQTMNASGTSGTYSPAALMYYAFSRYFNATVKVPVAVYRSMDRQAHFDRVTNKAHTKNMGKGAMNKAGWRVLFEAERNPSSYRAPTELFTDSQKQIFGFLGDGSGERYGAEINGIRSAWGDRQNLDFQDTPAFRALRAEEPLDAAIVKGLAEGMRDTKIKKAMGPGASKFQMATWMKELSEIALFDHIFSQQDRVGNVDYKWFVFYKDADGRVKSDKLDSDLPREQMEEIDYPHKGEPGVELVQRTRINDNDAGGKVEYTNFTKRTKMLQNIRHMDPETYKKLLNLDADFRANGVYAQYLKTNFNLSAPQISQVINNTREAAEILRSTCKAGKMRFDLDSVKKAFEGDLQEVSVDCENP